jgi:hypothetical protein
MRAVAIVMIFLLSLLSPLAQAVDETVIIVTGDDTNADLETLSQLGITPIADAEHGWGEADPETDQVWLYYRNANLVPTGDWPHSIIEGWTILHHEYPVPSQWRAQLAMDGIECESFLPPSSIRCDVPALSPAKLLSLDVTGLMKMDPTDKVYTPLAKAMNGDIEMPYTMEGYATMNLLLSSTELPEVKGMDIHSDSRRYATISGDIDVLSTLALSEDIEWIEPKVLYTTHNDEADAVIKTNWVSQLSNLQALNPSWTGLDGSGIVVTVGDSGIDTGVNDSTMHDDFEDHMWGIMSWPIPSSSRGQCTSNSNWDDGPADENGHGTHVAGSVLGDGTVSSGAIKGSAPEADLLFHSYAQVCDGSPTLMGIPDDINDAFDLAAENGSLIHTNSWGISAKDYPWAAGYYGTNSRQADEAANSHTNMSIMFSAGNDGADGNADGEVDLDSQGPPSTAKNVISIGASENNRPTFNSYWSSFPSNPITNDKVADNIDGMAAFSSRGPMQDNRIKPDISAPGTFILSTKSSVAGACGWGAYSTEYCYMGGTSMATPLSAGASALLLEHLKENVGHSDPSSALVKALLTANADDMLGQYSDATNGAGETAPNNHEGWGRLNLENAMEMSFVDGDSVGTGDWINYSFNVPVGAPDMRIMLAWTDAAASTAASVTLVNEISYNIRMPDGTWLNESNNRDNLIGESISSPQSGNWQIQIEGTNVPNGPQKFAIALSENYSISNLTTDADFDGFNDDSDDCPTSAGYSNQDRNGCPDTDGDGYSDADGSWTTAQGADIWPNDSTQWSDTDGDGYGDSPGGTDPDGCPLNAGTSTTDRLGCQDPDGDGWSTADGLWTTGNGADGCPAVFGTSTGDQNGCPDGDGDGYSDSGDTFPSDSSEWYDTDSDTIGDNADACPNNAGTSTEDQIGCPDGDSDGYSDSGDAFPSDVNEWNDTDSDNVGDNSDDCPTTTGTSTVDLLGCPDSDSDGYSDGGDQFPNDGSEWEDTDSDGFGDNADDCDNDPGTSTEDQQGCIDGDGDGWSDSGDDFPLDTSEWLDSDGDNIGDNSDDCDNIAGNSTADLIGCLDTDGDGWSDANDNWPNDPTRWADADSDGITDDDDDCPSIAGNSTIGAIGCIDSDGDGRANSGGYDSFPDDKTQWADGDGDGRGDNPNGNLPDACPNELGTSWRNNTLGCPDADSDGWADSQDDYDSDDTQWSDEDGDGYGDNSLGNNPDACPSEAGDSTLGGSLGCPDTDSDGYGDVIDAFDNDDTQYSDQDGDGYGDAASGTTPDECLTVWGNSSLDRKGCLDRDGDGVSDLGDSFPDDSTRSDDEDGDGFEDFEDDCWQVPGTSRNGSMGCIDADFDSWADQNDSFPLDITQWNDDDNDGYGNNPLGNNSDDCPLISGTSIFDYRGCLDSDGDGWSDTTDLYDSDPTDWNDTDGDGFGDNADGCASIAGNSINGSLGCPDSDGDSWSDETDFDAADPLNWVDLDGDGWGNLNDACPGINATSTHDRLGCTDEDGDGWSTGDELWTTANGADAFPTEGSQWNDTDGDGYGDNNLPGDKLADYWPDEPSRNIAEVSLICQSRPLEVDLNYESLFSFSCTVVNGIQSPISLRLEMRQLSSIQSTMYSYIFTLGLGEDATQMVAFTGTALSEGENVLVVEASELGADAALASQSIELIIINSSLPDVEPFTDDSQSQISHVQEITAISVVASLIIFLTIIRLRSSGKKKLIAARELELGRITASGGYGATAYETFR